MPCPTNAPINLPTAINQPCSTNCNFTYDYGLSNCSVTNKSTYLDIKCFDGINSVKSDMIDGSLYVNNVRLYSPSLNSYDGFKADAEIIITHTGGGRTLYVCIPIISSEKESNSAKWFRQVIQFSPTRKNTSKSINVNNFTLNHIVPQSAFTIYNKGTFDWNCARDNIIILFHKNEAVNMKDREYKILVSLIKKSNYALQTPEDNLIYNKKGTGNGPGHSKNKKKVLKCRPITFPDGSPIVPQKNDNLLWVGGKEAEGSDKFNNKWIVFIILMVILACLLMYGLAKLWGKIFGKKIGNTSGGLDR